MRVSKATNLGQMKRNPANLSALTWHRGSKLHCLWVTSRDQIASLPGTLWREVCLDVWCLFLILMLFLTFSDLLHFCLMPSTQCLQCVAQCDKKGLLGMHRPASGKVSRRKSNSLVKSAKKALLESPESTFLRWITFYYCMIRYVFWCLNQLFSKITIHLGLLAKACAVFPSHAVTKKRSINHTIWGYTKTTAYACLYILVHIRLV